MGRFKCGLKYKGWVNSVIINVSTKINYRYNYIHVVLKIYIQCKNMYTISALYQIINLNVST